MVTGTFLQDPFSKGQGKLELIQLIIHKHSQGQKHASTDTAPST
jgi:hypothetical protein